MIEKAPQINQTTASRPPAAANWPLLLGGILVMLVIIVALFGPLLAPQDPMKASYIAEYQDRYIRPPFPPGVEGYPLGSDEIGRDILSRLFWAVRPTMILVLVVAAVRLSLGILLGIISGWSSGRLARTSDTLISNALAVPVLFVALCVIAGLANRWGVWAFILGLSITGWAESARLAQEQTRLIKGQPFVEATRAMGANAGQIILSHIIPHIMPLMWIQMAFEISSSLLTTAALGFLGYFVNAIWVPTDSDFIALRASGMPELGQMLGISIGAQPWTAVFAGSVIFLIVLALNLFGEGLRSLLNPERQRRRAESTQMVDRAGNWVSERVYGAVSEWRRSAATSGIFTVLFIVIVGGGWILWNAQNTRLVESKIRTTGGHMWPAQPHDAQGTYWSTAHGPLDAALLWTYIGPGAIIGGPVVDRGGNLYLNISGQKLVIIGSDGKGLKIINLPAEPFGWPALTAEGNIIVADERDALSAYALDGTLLWEYVSDPPGEMLASPIVGPSGIIYFPDNNFLIAVTPDGKRLWQIQLPTYSITSPLPRLSPDGEYLFFEDFVIDAKNGKTLFSQSSGPADKYLVGANGKVYFRTSDSFFEWQTTETGAVMLLQAKLDTNVIAANQRFPFDAGVSPSGNPWLLYSNGFEFLRMIWTDPKGNSPQVVDLPYRLGTFIGIDANGVGYVCGAPVKSEGVECRAVQLNTGVVLWKYIVDPKIMPVGGALVEGKLYIALQDGRVLALGR
jgi:peptide/nickel transport system permease protein